VIRSKYLFHSVFLIFATVTLLSFQTGSDFSLINRRQETVDSTITISSGQNGSNVSCITAKETERFIYRHFNKFGALPRNKIKDYSKGTLCIEYDTIYHVMVNKRCQTIVRYWLNPADLNGTCVQPSWAIVTKFNKTLKLTNEGFLKPNFQIDSIVPNTIIYGSEYDCTEQKITKKYKLKLAIK